MSSKVGKRAIVKAVDRHLEDIYVAHFYDILDASKFLLSDIKPSEWAEQNRTMGSDETSRPGPFSYQYTPYLKEVIDCLSENHPARVIAVKKGAQIGFSTGVIENGMGWIIAQNPGNVLFLSGSSELSEEAMNGKIDKMIDSCHLRHFIKATTLRRRNQRTGDTAKAKEFPGGSITAGSASNHKLLRQRSVKVGFIDDFDGAKMASAQAGSTRSLVKQRFAAYYDKMKLFLISTPELEETSNIQPEYLLGDQRLWHVPCPCCGERIPLIWEVPIEGKDGEMGGINWKIDDAGKLIPESVGYICQKCGGWFDDSRKMEMNLAGEWVATAEPSEIGYYSYHISCLYAPPGMYDWTYYVRQYLAACPPGARRKEKEYQAFVNLCLGETYKPSGEAPEAKILQGNIRKYEIGTVPERLSMADGNGKIIILTCACDLNGTENDARLDYEILAWAEKDGVSYSVKHGSIGTFIPKEGTKKVKEDRERWTYDPYKRNNVWTELDRIISDVYMTDSPNPTADDRFHVGRKMKIAITGVDTGHFTTYAYHFIDKHPTKVIGVRGDKESKFRKYDADTASFKPAKERGALFMIDVNYVKDVLAENMKLKWDPQHDSQQPPGFMNYPIPSGGLYLLNNYFAHYEAEHKVAAESKTGEMSYLWKKKTSAHQNHFLDVRIYNMALRDIVVDITTREVKIKKGTWADFCLIIKSLVKS
jgi:phage terminase large subunit GpA-like protein